MNYRTLGKTGLKISDVGMGTWQLANDPNCWVGSDLNESMRSLYRYVELGGNFVDTAWIYGYDESRPQEHPSEQLIAKFLDESGNRNQVIVATKIPGKNMSWPALYGVPIEEVFPDEWIVSCVHDSLRSLNTDSLDLVQFHVWQDEFSEHDGWKQTIQKLTREGKVKHWGISINDYQPSNCLKTLDTGLIETIQFIFNIFHQKPTEKLLPYAKEHNIGLIARVPLDEGGLTGKFTLDTQFENGDFRQKYFSPDRLVELVKRTDDLKKLLGDDVRELSELALRYILSFEEISTVIPGLRRVAHVESNLSVSGKNLSPQVMEALKSHRWERNFIPVGQDPALAESGGVEV